MLGNADIELVFNETKFWLSGLVEAVYNRWLGRHHPTTFTKNVSARIIHRLQSVGENAVIMCVAHSQGCLQLMNAVNLLPFHLRKRLHLVLFASPTRYEVDGVWRVEYFYNDEDIVVKDLVRHYPKSIWRTYVREGSGHGLVSYYLNQIDEFRRVADGKKSLFAQLCEK